MTLSPAFPRTFRFHRRRRIFWSAHCLFSGKSKAVVDSPLRLAPQLVGHSMGAPPIVHAVPELKAKGFRTIGVVVLDVVEGVYCPTNEI